MPEHRPLRPSRGWPDGMGRGVLKGPDTPKRRRLNADEKHRLQVAEIRLFAKQYARKARKGLDPNDRRYERETERRIKRMRPDERDGLLRDEE